MIEPTSSLFYEIITEQFPNNRAFAIKAIKEVRLVPKDDKLCPTLCIDGKGVIRVNEGFWRKNIRSRRDATYVFLHEMFHSVLGDLLTMISASNSYERQLMNLSMDMRINAAVNQFIYKPKGNGYQRYADVFQRMYPKSGPGGLLRSNSTYGTTNKYNLIYRSLYSDHLNEAEDARAKEMFQSEESIRSALRQLLPKNKQNEDKLSKIGYIGNHNPQDQEGDEDSFTKGEQDADLDKKEDAILPNERKEVEAPPIIEPLEEDVKEEMRDAIMDEIHAQGGRGAARSGVFFNSVVEVIESSRKLQTKAIEAFCCDAKINELKVMFEKPRKFSSVVPLNPSNREIALLSAGWTPSRWTNKRRDVGKKNRNIAIYLDVSGSVGSYLPRILGVIATLRQGINTIFCFSNEVHEHKMQELNEGKYTSTGGTDFDCIVEHALENEINKMIIFTDGCAYINKDNEAKAKEKIEDAAIIYFGYKNPNNFFTNQYNKTFELDELVK